MKLERLSLSLTSYLMVLVCVLHIDQDFFSCSMWNKVIFGCFTFLWGLALGIPERIIVQKRILDSGFKF